VRVLKISESAIYPFDICMYITVQIMQRVQVMMTSFGIASLDASYASQCQDEKAQY
jgi:hypothetical protein